MPIGAHVSTSGGLSTAIGRAQAIGAECMQVFLCAPQQWRLPRHEDEQIASFRQLVGEAGLGPNFAHAVYLINLASADPAIREKSVASLSACVEWADRCGLDGVVVHVGSSKGQPLEEAERNVASALEEILGRGGDVAVLLENSAGAGNTLGARFEQLGRLIDRVGRPDRLGLCLDTAHTFASGYDLRLEDGLTQALDEVDAHVGLERLKVIHANDSKSALASALDRHENIGQGQIGEDGFERMLQHAALAGLPWVLEVPGTDKQGPDLANVHALKRLAGRS
jgi:deoxyribonuclease IV